MSAEPVVMDLDPERLILGAALLNSATLQTTEGMVRVEHLTDPRHRAIYAALLTMSAASRSIDLVTLKAELEASGQLDSAGGLVYLAGLVDGLPRLSNVEAWARTVRERARREAVIGTARTILDEADEPGMETDVLIDRAVSRLGKLLESGERRIVRLRDVLPRAVKDLEEFAASQHGVTGIPTGLVDLDECLGGLHPGRLYIVAGRTSRGKSVLCAQITVEAARRGHRGLVFSMEMEPWQLAQRMLLADAEVDRWQVRKESEADFAWSKVTSSYGRLDALPVWFDQRESPNLLQVRASVKQQASGPGLDLVVVDYLQRLHVDPKLDRWLAVGDAVRGLKSLAMSMRVPVVAACQLNADAEEKRPTLASLAQAQSIISAEADAVILLHPDDLVKWKTQRFPLVHFLVDKNRHGPCVDVIVSFEKEHSKFVNAAIGSPS